MNQLDRWLRGSWGIPAISGTLILAAFAVQFLAGGTADEALTPRWWLDAGVRATHSKGAFTLSDALMLAAAIAAGYRIAISAFRALTVKFISIDLLVSVAAIGAVLIGNFWEAAAVTFLFSVGHALEAATMNKTRSALAELVAVAPDSAVVLRGGDQVEIPAAQVQLGEAVLVKTGAKVPVDGIVTSGIGTIDEASITGESIPVQKTEGDRVFAGTVSHGGFMQVEATGVGADTTLARIIHRVEEAQDAKAKTQSFIDRFSRWYTPGVMILALAAGLITGDAVLALTLLVIGCPGALVISIPVAIVAGIGRAARNGILIKGGEYLETAAKINAVALDKTGTLTVGRPELTDIVALADMPESEVLRLAAAAEAGSDHPLARPIVAAARQRGISPGHIPEEVTPVIGKGIYARVESREVLVGNAALMERHDIGGVTGGVDDAESRAESLPESPPESLAEVARVADGLAEQGKTPMLVAVDGKLVGIVAVADQIRSDAPEMIKQLHQDGVKKILMLTGDQHKVARAVASATGVDEVHASLLPEDKLEVVAQLQREGYTVAMVGDGVNDAPALAAADIGVAMGAEGSAVAVETADIALMGDNLLKLPEAISLAKRTNAVMRQNIGIALFVVAILLGGVFASGVTMSLGMLVHEGSVLIVILNAMRLLRQGRRPIQGAETQDVQTQDVQTPHLQNAGTQTGGAQPMRLSKGTSA